MDVYADPAGVDGASMEPGHEDREYATSTTPPSVGPGPQWSPVMKTGNTSTEVRR